MSFLGIDLGTSFIKGAVLNLETRQLEHIRRAPFPERIATGNPLECEYDPQEILAAVRTLIKELVSDASGCQGIVMCAQMHSLVLMNDRAPVSNCLTWRDERVLAPHPSGLGSYFDAILSRTTSRMRRELGNELEPARPICFLYRFAQEGKLTSGLIPVSLPDFVMSALCDSDPGVEATHASAYGALNLETSDWHYELIRKLGLDHLQWPTIRELGEIIGHVKINTSLVPCYTPVGDAQAALAGALLSADELSLNIATGAQVSRLTNRLCLGDYQTRPFFDGKYINTFSYPPAGRSLNVLVSLFTELAAAQNLNFEDPWAYFVNEAGKVEDTDLEVDLNFFAAREGKHGQISNMHAGNLTCGHLFRAALNSMADSYYKCAIQLWPEKSWKNLLFSGGLACKLDLLREIVQKKFGTGSRLAPFSEDTLFGLLMLASVFSGESNSLEQICRELSAREIRAN